MRKFDQLRSFKVKRDGFVAWGICFWALATYGIAVGIDSSFGVIIGSLMEGLETSTSTISWIASTHSSFMYLFSWISTMLTQKYGFRSVFIGGAIISSMAYIGAAFTEDFVSLCLTYGVIAGAGSGLLYAPGSIVVTYYFDKHREIATGIAICGGGVGVAIIDSLANCINIKFGSHGVFIAYALLSLLPVILGILMFPTSDNEGSPDIEIDDSDEKYKENIKKLRRITFHPMTHKFQNQVDQVTIGNETNLKTNIHASRRTSMPKLSNQELVVPAVNEERESKSFFYRFDILKDSRIIFYCLTHIMFLLGFYIHVDYLPEMMVVDHGLPITVEGTIMTIFGVSSVVGRIASGVIANFIAKHAIMISTFSLVGIGSGIIGLAICSTYQVFIGITVFHGLCVGSFYFNSVQILVEIYGVTDKLQDAYGAIMLASAVGPLCGPPIGGMLHDFFGSYEKCFYAAGTFSFIAAVFNLSVFLIHHRNYKK